MSHNKLSKTEQPEEPRGEILLYQTGDGQVRVLCLFREENLWLTQKAVAELFDVEVPAISKHLSNIFDTNELEREATVSILETVRQEGSRQVKRKIEYYSLDAIIAVGYRVNSYQATQFRICLSGFGGESCPARPSDANAGLGGFPAWLPGIV